MRLGQILGMTWLSGSMLLGAPRGAHACAGCFTPPPPSTSPSAAVVTGHRMALAISPARSVLWDQIQYAGAPEDFSWVLPVHGDANLEVAEDAWFEALDAVTSTVISPPQLNCFAQTTTSSSGCSCGGDSTTPNASPGASGGTNSDGITVDHQGTAGPYQFVQLSATSSPSLQQWLLDNGYAIPPEVAPVVDAYVQENFDFLILRLRPGLGIHAMTPVRVITDGASPVLPLRMVAAGTGPFVAITLYVIAEGRYEPSGFASAKVNLSQLSWDWSQSKSNYTDLRQQALATDNGRTWLTSFAESKGFTRTLTDVLGQPLTFTAQRTTAPPSDTVSQYGNLTDLYFAEAAANNSTLDGCQSVSFKLSSGLRIVDTCHAALSGTDAGVPSADAAVSSSTATDAAITDAGIMDAISERRARPDAANDATTRLGRGVDGGRLVYPDASSEPPPGTVCDPTPPNTLAARDVACGGFSDISTALIGLVPTNVWITRLESNLPREALAADLSLQLATSQDEIASAHRATIHVNPPCDLLENHPEVALDAPASVGHRGNEPIQRAGIGLVSLVGLLWARRLTRQRR